MRHAHVETEEEREPAEVNWRSQRFINLLLIGYSKSEAAEMVVAEAQNKPWRGAR